MSRRDEAWRARLLSLLRFRSQHGHTAVPVRWPEEPALGFWAARLRTRGPKRLPRELREALEEAGFLWSLAQGDWGRLYRELAAFYAQNGHFEIPEQPEFTRLRGWLALHRERWRQNRLPAAHYHRLQRIGPVFPGPDPEFAIRARELTEFRSRFGNAPVPASYGDGSLYAWVRRQSVVNTRSQLATPKLLASLGITDGLQARQLRDWHAAYARLVALQLPVEPEALRPTRRPPPGLKYWLTKQRTRYRRGQLPEELAQRLRQAGFAVLPRRESFDGWIRQIRDHRRPKGYLAVFRDRPGRRLWHWWTEQLMGLHRTELSEEQRRAFEELAASLGAGRSRVRPKATRSPTGSARQLQWDRQFARLAALQIPPGASFEETEETRGLSIWLRRQRRLARRGELPPELKQRLESLGVWFSLDERNWNRKLAELQSFYSVHRHTRVPRTSPQHRRLAMWLVEQRSEHRKGQLPATRRDQLEALGVEWEPTPSRQGTERSSLQTNPHWERQFARLAALPKLSGASFKETEETKETRGLSLWLRRQRRLARRGELPPELKQRLESLGVWFSLDERNWNRKATELQSFYAANGHTRVPRTAPKLRRLATWLVEQRSENRKGSLPEARKSQLEALGVEWEPAPGRRKPRATTAGNEASATGSYGLDGRRPDRMKQG